MNRGIDLDTLYRSLAPALYARCRAILSDEEEARDAVHDIFLRLDSKLDSFRSEASISTWAFRISTNHCIDRLRTRRRWASFLEILAGQYPIPEARGLGEQVEIRSELESLLSRFDKRKVQILVHYYHDRMTQQEIAEVMGISDRAVRKALRNIRDRVASQRPAPTGQDQ